MVEDSPIWKASGKNRFVSGLLGYGVSHRIQFRSKRTAHFGQPGIAQKILVVRTVENHKLVPEHRHGAEGRSQDGMTGTKVKLPVDTEFVFYCVVHRAEPSHCLADLIAQSVRLAKLFTPRPPGLTELKEARIATQNRSESAAHDSNCPYWPHLVEDKPHYDEGNQYSHKTVSGWRQFRGSTEPLKRNEVESESNLQPDIVETPPRAAPRSDEGDRRYQYNQ